jgi:serine/threonine protein kinase
MTSLSILASIPTVTSIQDVSIVIDKPLGFGRESIVYSCHVLPEPTNADTASGEDAMLPTVEQPACTEPSAPDAANETEIARAKLAIQEFLRSCSCPLDKALVVKRIKFEAAQMTSEQYDKVLAALGSKCRSKHIQILPIVRVTESADILFVYPRAACDLLSYMMWMHDCGIMQWPEHDMRHVMRMIVRGVAALHKRHVSHSDIKPENILLYLTAESWEAYDKWSNGSKIVMRSQKTWKHAPCPSSSSPEEEYRNWVSATPQDPSSYEPSPERDIVNVQICDFGVASCHAETLHLPSHCFRTPQYQPPEEWHINNSTFAKNLAPGHKRTCGACMAACELDKGQSEAAQSAVPICPSRLAGDVWGIGAIAHIMRVGNSSFRHSIGRALPFSSTERIRRSPFVSTSCRADDATDVMWWWMHPAYINVDVHTINIRRASISCELASVLKQALTISPLARISARALKRLPWFTAA